MTITYLTFGQKTEFHVQAFLSMLSFRRQMEPHDRIVVVTTAPEFYRHALGWAEVIAVDDAQIEQWQGEHRFFWRAKIKAIEHVGQLYPADDLLYLDCDTFLSGDILWLRRQMAGGRALMDTNEGHPSSMRTKTLRMWHTVGGRTYGGVTLGPSHDMYCAGVVGIPATVRTRAVSLALTLCDGMLADGAERIVIEQYSLSVALQETTAIAETKDCIAHYWAAKDEWMQAAMTMMAKILLTAATPDEQLQLLAETPWHSLPVYVHKSSTARRLRRLVARLFPDSRHRYIATK